MSTIEMLFLISGNILTSNLIDQFKNTNIDAIFHVAGVNKMCSKNPQYMFDANIDGTKNILNLGNQLGISRFVYTSSAVTLGENLGSIGNENSTHRGYYLSKYEESKFLAEKEAFNFKKNLAFGYINNDISNDELNKKDLFIEVEKKKYPIDLIIQPLKQTNFKNN